MHPVFKHLINICFLQCICLWPISQIQTWLCAVVRPGLVSILPAFMRSSASRPAGTHGRLVQKTLNRASIYGGRRGRHNLHSVTPLLVCYVVWILVVLFYCYITRFIINVEYYFQYIYFFFHVVVSCYRWLVRLMIQLRRDVGLEIVLFIPMQSID